MINPAACRIFFFFLISQIYWNAIGTSDRLYSGDFLRRFLFAGRGRDKILIWYKIPGRRLEISGRRKQQESELGHFPKLSRRWLLRNVIRHENFQDFSWFQDFLVYKNPEIMQIFHILNKKIIIIVSWSQVSGFLWKACSHACVMSTPLV